MDLKAIMQQARDLQSKMNQAQTTLANTRATGVSGGGLVTVTLDGKSQLVGVEIDPSLMVAGDEGVLEDLIRVAHAEAKQRIDAVAAEATQGMMAGMPNLPFKLPGL